MLKNKKLIILSFFLILTNLVIAKCDTQSLSKEREIKNISSLSKVWGFLKYYHPNVADGKYNWDKEFLRMLPKVEKLNDSEELSNVLLDWINNLGPIKECKSCNTSKNVDYFESNFNLSWIQNNNIFTNDLFEKLKDIEENRFQGKHHYVETNRRGILSIKNEIQTSDFNYPNRNYRLLSLARYWNIVEYFYPYKYQIDTNWDDVLTEMIPKFIEASNSSEYQLAMLETVVKLDDTHSDFYSEEIGNFFGKKLIPYQLELVEEKVVVSNFLNDSLAQLNNLRIGDIIETIQAEDIHEIIKKYNKYLNGSNLNTKYRDLQFKISSGNSDSVEIGIVRDDTHLKKTISRYDWMTINSNNEGQG